MRESDRQEPEGGGTDEPGDHPGSLRSTPATTTDNQFGLWPKLGFVSANHKITEQHIHLCFTDS